MDKKNWEVSVLFCTDNYIKQLNNRYRGKDEPTDVLSFLQDDKEDITKEIFYAGDIVVSIETITKQAERFKVKVKEELARMLIHGVLHLCGEEHETNNEEEPMLLIQEKILKHCLGE